MKTSRQFIWPTKVETYQFVGNEEHFPTIRNIVLSNGVDSDFQRELKVYDLHEIDHPSIHWLKENYVKAAREYLEVNDKLAVSSLAIRSVVMRHGNHISTHDEKFESDLTLAYWGDGYSGEDDAISAVVDPTKYPQFIIEDGTRMISDLRLPFEDRHSIYIRPRAGMCLVAPNYVPHNMHPYLGTEPFLHIVCSIRFDWGKEYLKRY